MENEIRLAGRLHFLMIIFAAALLVSLASGQALGGSQFGLPIQDVVISSGQQDDTSFIGLPADLDQQAVGPGYYLDVNSMINKAPGLAAAAAGPVLWGSNEMDSDEMGLLEPQVARRRVDNTQQQQQQQDSGYVVDDTNSHLPANDPLVLTSYGLLSSPVNDPAEFEAAMSQLTDRLNHRLPNSANRSLALDNLLINLNSYYQQLRHDPSTDSIGVQEQPEHKSTPTKSELIERIGRLLASSSSSSSPLQQTDDQDDDDDEQTTSVSSGASEYIDHPLALVGHQYVQGGAGEGRQLLGPEGTFENVQVIKSDHAVPSYCDPPNPCPLGYSAADGCLEEFVNSASFSREYQAKQQCSCDNEHSLFNCAAGPASNSLKNQHVAASSDTDALADNGGDGDAADDDDRQPNQSQSQSRDEHENEADSQDTDSAGKLNILARTIQNRFGDLESVRNLVAKHQTDMEDSSLVSINKRKDLDG